MTHLRNFELGVPQASSRFLKTTNEPRRLRYAIAQKQRDSKSVTTRGSAVSIATCNFNITQRSEGSIRRSF